MIETSFALSESDVNSFRETGFLKLKNIFSSKVIAHLQALSSGQVTAPSDNYGSGFSRLKYDVGNDDPGVLELVSDVRFKEIMLTLCGEPVFFTQGLGFELQKNKGSGFPWHVGTQSFGFQRQNDLGYTIWTPLSPIDPKGQRGGMAYVPRNKLSGEFVYQHINLLPEYIRHRIESGHDVDFNFFSTIKNNLLNSDTMGPLLDFYGQEDSFELGDALIFDKHVMHRSIPLGEGPLESRLAYALRFSSTSALYDKRRTENLAYPRSLFDYDVGSPFNDEVCSQDGESIYYSPYFDRDRQARTIDNTVPVSP